MNEWTLAPGVSHTSAGVLKAVTSLKQLMLAGIGVEVGRIGEEERRDVSEECLDRK